MLIASAVLLLAEPAGLIQSDPICETRPEACRAVAPFELRMGDKSYPIDLQWTRPWITDGRLTLYPGESVVVNIDTPDKPVVESASAASAVISDERAAGMAGLLAPGGAFEGAEGHAGMAAGEPLENQPAKRLRLTFRQAPGSDDMLLVVENEHAASLTYDAGMLHIGEDGLLWSATSVCTVRPGIFNMEHWPHPIVALSIGGFALDPSAPDEVVCR